MATGPDAHQAERSTRRRANSTGRSPPAYRVIRVIRATRALRAIAKPARPPTLLTRWLCAKRGDIRNPIVLEAASQFAKTLLARCQSATAAHPRRVAATVLSVLGLFAVTAFGIAPLAPDAAKLPQRLVQPTLIVSELGQQLRALADHRLDLSRSHTTRGNETADSLLRKLGVADPIAAAFIRQDRQARRLLDGQPGKMVQARSAADGTLIELTARFAALDSKRTGTHFTRLTIARAGQANDGRFASVLETAALVPQIRIGSGTVRSSLWAATDDAKLPEAIAEQLIEVFSGDIDFHRQLRKGDTFSVVYETLTADDQAIGWIDSTGRITAAEFVNNGRARQAMWYQAAGSAKGDYFGPDGQNRRRMFLASPVEFSRVTSGFAMRIHPIAQNWRAHHGVDYSAPQGTPVQAVGGGIVEFAGRQSGYGNMVQLQHDNGKSTVYAHLSQIDVQKDQRVAQGQRIGAVGATGWATGPHLHFELRINGEYQDPLQLAGDIDHQQIDPAARAYFSRLAAQAQRQLHAAQSVVGFRGDAE